MPATRTAGKEAGCGEAEPELTRACDRKGYHSIGRTVLSRLERDRRAFRPARQQLSTITSASAVCRGRKAMYFALSKHLRRVGREAFVSFDAHDLGNPAVAYPVVERNFAKSALGRMSRRNTYRKRYASKGKRCRTSRSHLSLSRCWLRLNCRSRRPRCRERNHCACQPLYHTDGGGRYGPPEVGCRWRGAFANTSMLTGEVQILNNAVP
jgi:hypothetical protein